MDTGNGPTNDPAADEIKLSELVEMFREAAPRGPCPTEEMIDRCAFLHTTTWVPRGIASASGPRREGYEAEQDARKALATLSTALPQVIDIHRKLVGLPPFFPHRIKILEGLNKMLPLATAALGRDLRRHTRSAPWMVVASLTACEAMDAWSQAGRKKFGKNQTSPLVRFTKAFLARAGINVDESAISRAFQRGLLDRIHLPLRPEPPTTENLQL